MRDSGARYALDAAAAALWCAPEMTAALAEHAGAAAAAVSDHVAVLEAMGWAVAGRAAIGEAIPAATRAIDVLNAATRAGEHPRSGRLLVGLAGAAREVGELAAARRLLSAVLAQADDVNLRADAMIEAAQAASVARENGLDELIESALHTARGVGGEGEPVRVAALHRIAAAAERRNGRAEHAAELALNGLASLATDAETGPTMPHVAAALTLELVQALFDTEAVDEALDAGRAALAWPMRAGTVEPLGWLRLAIAGSSVVVGDDASAVASLETAVGTCSDRELPGLEAACHTRLAELYEARRDLEQALAATRNAAAAEQRRAGACETFRLCLAQSGGMLAAPPQPAARSRHARWSGEPSERSSTTPEDPFGAEPGEAAAPDPGRGTEPGETAPDARPGTEPGDPTAAAPLEDRRSTERDDPSARESRERVVAERHERRTAAADLRDAEVDPRPDAELAGPPTWVPDERPAEPHDRVPAAAEARTDFRDDPDRSVTDGGVHAAPDAASTPAGSDDHVPATSEPGSAAGHSGRTGYPAQVVDGQLNGQREAAARAGTGSIVLLSVGHPDHAVDLATVERALTSFRPSIASRLPRDGRLVESEPNAVAILLTRTDRHAAEQWVRGLCGELAEVWPFVCSELPGGKFQVAVAADDGDNDRLERLVGELCTSARTASTTPQPAANALPAPQRSGAVGAPRHLRDTAEQGRRDPAGGPAAGPDRAASIPSGNAASADNAVSTDPRRAPGQPSFAELVAGALAAYRGT